MPCTATTARPYGEYAVSDFVRRGELRATMRAFSASARVAQLDRASVYGTEGCGFESCHACWGGRSGAIERALLSHNRPTSFRRLPAEFARPFTHPCPWTMRSFSRRSERTRRRRSMLPTSADRTFTAGRRSRRWFTCWRVGIRGSCPSYQSTKVSPNGPRCDRPAVFIESHFLPPWIRSLRGPVPVTIFTPRRGARQAAAAAG